MRRHLARLSFRARLTLWWTLAFGVVLTIAVVAIYSAFRIYLYDDFDVNLRTVAATELASSTDRADIHLHELPAGAFGDGQVSDKFVQIFEADGRVRLGSRMLLDTRPLLESEQIADVLAGSGLVVPVTVHGRPARAAAVSARMRDERYVVLVGMFLDPVAAHLQRLAWVLAVVWIVAITATAGVGYWLASRALVPILGITRRAAHIAQGAFSSRLDEPSLDDEVGVMTRSLNDVLERLHGALEANRMFAADTSHELRAPLSAMAGAVDVTLKHPRSSDEYREALSAVRERVSEMTRLCDDLMLLAHAQEGGRGLDLREVPLGWCLDASVHRLAASAAAKQIALETRDTSVLVAYADPRLLARVFDNVIANAVVHNKPGGRVQVSGRIERLDPSQWKTDIVVVDVSDTGPGIPAEDIERVFDRFYRVDRSRTRETGGTGLGLAICREVLRVLGGSIRVAHTSSAGTTFEIRIPGRAAVAEPVAAS